MIIVNKRDVALVDGGLVTEASTIGLRPGVWPRIISVVDDAHTGFLFLQAAPITHAGEFGGFTYYTRPAPGSS